MLRPGSSRWWLRAGGSAVAVGILLAIVPVGELWLAVRDVHPVVWLAAVAIFIAGHALNAVKLWILVGPHAAPLDACLRAHFTGIAANLGLPGVAGGEIIRVGYLAPTAGTARVALAAVADRLVDGLVLVGIVLVASRVAGLPLDAGSTPRLVLRWLLVLGVVLSAVVTWRLRRRRGTDGSAQLREAWHDLLGRPLALGGAMGISLGVQTLLVLTNVWLGTQVGLSAPLAPWFLAWTASKLSALLPVSLGGIGVREATLVSVLAAYGAPADLVLATGVLWEGAIIAGSLTGFLVLQLLHRRHAPVTPPRSR